MLMAQTDVIRRKVSGGRSIDDASPAQGAARQWPLALGRAARDQMALGLEVTALSVSNPSLAELLDIVPERSLIAVLEGPHDGLGIMVLSPAILAGLIEVQTLGRVTATAALPRSPTRTDAAMVAGWIDLGLSTLQILLAHDAELSWVDGFQYASFLTDSRPLGLLLEDVPFRLIVAEVSLAQGVKAGPVLLALPSHGRGRKPLPSPHSQPITDAGPIFERQMQAQIMLADCALLAVISRLRMPLAQLLALGEGDILPLGKAAIDQINVETTDGRPLAEGKLGQHRGHRAVRLTRCETGDADAMQRVAVQESVSGTPVQNTAFPELRATG
jgi:flagellar motor switch protein FliM